MTWFTEGDSDEFINTHQLRLSLICTVLSGQSKDIVQRQKHGFEKDGNVLPTPCEKKYEIPPNSNSYNPSIHQRPIEDYCMVYDYCSL